MPPIYVISLARALRRREDIRARLEKAGFRYEFADAVDGASEKNRSALVRREAAIVDDRIYRLSRGRALSNGEIGCYLSHYNLWGRIAAGKPECALVFEDDARWDEDLPDVVADVLSSRQKWGLCLLTSDKGKCAFRKLQRVGANKEGGGGRWLGYPFKRTMALAGYLIKKDAAQNLCARLRVIREPVDIALCRHWEWRGMRLSVRPHVVRHDEMQTTINDRGEGGAGRTVWNQIYGGIVNAPEWCRRIAHYCAIRPRR